MKFKKNGTMENRMNFRNKIQYVSQLEGERFECNEIEIEKEYLRIQNDKSSIAIKILSVLGGFFATLAFLGFLLIAGLYNSEEGLAVSGFFFIGVAIFLSITYKKLIIDTLSISAFAIGLCLVSYGLSELEFSDNTIILLFIIVSFLTIGITKNYILTFLSILIINGSIIFLIVDNEFYNYIHLYNAILLSLLTYVFLNEAKLLSFDRFLSILYNPVRIGLLISLLFVLAILSQKGNFDFDIKQIWISSIITISLTIYVISIILKIIGISGIKTLSLIYSLCTVFFILTALSPAISGSLLIIILCFRTNYKTGLLIGILSFVYFIFQYYYNLNFSLLTKSIILFVSGIVFLLFYLFTHKKLDYNEKV